MLHSACTDECFAAPNGFIPEVGPGPSELVSIRQLLQMFILEASVRYLFLFEWSDCWVS